MYTKSGGEVRIYRDGSSFTSRPPDWKKIMDRHLAERARLDALWRAEQEAAEKAHAGESSQR